MRQNSFRVRTQKLIAFWTAPKPLGLSLSNSARKGTPIYCYRRQKVGSAPRPARICRAQSGLCITEILWWGNFAI